jgi:hypothetical protein
MASMMLPIKDPLALLEAVELLEEVLEAVELLALEPLWWWPPWCLTSVGDFACTCAAL